MVLYKGEAFTIPTTKPVSSTSNDPIWSIKETGEQFTDHTIYLNRLAFYNKKQFDTELSSDQNLTFFDAFNIDSQNLNKIFDFIPIDSQLILAKYVYQLKIYNLYQLIVDVKHFLYDKNNNQDTFCVGETVILCDNSLKSDQQLDFVIKEKCTFDEVRDEITGNILISMYSKYLIEQVHSNTYHSDNGSNGDDSHLEYIVDGSMLKRKNELSVFNNISTTDNTNNTDDSFIESFIRLLFCNSDSHLLPTLKMKNTQLYNEIMDWNQANKSNVPRLILNKQVSSSFSSSSSLPAANPLLDNNDYDTNVPSDVNLDKSLVEQITIQDDLSIPFVGSTEYFDDCFRFNDQLENIPISSNNNPLRDKLTPTDTNNPINKLVEVYQFLLTFHQVLRLTPFNLDDLITSIKCTDPFELSGEVVNIMINGSPRDNPQIRRSQWERNHVIRDLINSKNDKSLQNHITYEILSNLPASDQRLESIGSNGMRLYIAVIICLLSLVIDEEGQWRCQIVEEWFDNNDIDDAELSLDSKLSNILNYNGVNWAERLSKREFRNGYWLIILLGVLQDSMHISKYTKIVMDFTEKIVPETLNGNVPKNIFFNFCKKMTISQKVDILWVLTDIVANYSDDIKKWINGIPKLVHEIRHERERLVKYHTAELSKLSKWGPKVDTFKNNTNLDPNMIKTMKMEIDNIKNNLRKFSLEMKYLDFMIKDYEDQNVQFLGVNRFGNRFYWINKKEHSRDSEKLIDADSLYYCGRLWIRGGIPEVVKSLLKITTQQYDKWIELAQTKGKAYATKEVFGVYRDPSGTYYSVENEVHVEIVSSKGLIVGDYKLSNIQQKIITESPENLLLNSNEWYCIQDVSSIRKILYNMNVGGSRESKLYIKIFSVLQEILTSFEIKNIVSGIETFDVVEERLLKELHNYECNEDELKNLRYLSEDDYNENSKEMVIVKSREHLEKLAQQINSIHDTKLTKRLLQRLKKLEYRRRLFFEEQGSKININSIGISTLNYLEQVDIDVIANAKLRKQMDILTYLLNYRHFKAIENLNRWRNSSEVSKTANGRTQVKPLVVENLLNQILQKIKSNITSNDWVPTKIDVFLQLETTEQGIQPVVQQGQHQQEIQQSTVTNEMSFGMQNTSQIQTTTQHIQNTNANNNNNMMTI